MAETGEPKPTYPVRYWRLKGVGNEADALFRTCNLPALTLADASLDHVGEQSLPQKTSVATNASWGDIQLTRGVDTNGKLWEWIKQGLPEEGGGGGKVEKKEVTIELCGGESHADPIMVYVFTGAWPSNYDGPNLDASSSEFAMESLTLKFDSAKVGFGGPPS